MKRLSLTAILLLAMTPFLPWTGIATLGLAAIAGHAIGWGLGRGATAITRSTRYTYDGWLIILVLATGLMALKDVAIAALMVTMGLAFPLLFAATPLAYGVCLRPAVVGWLGTPQSRRRGLALSVVAVLALALLPGWIGRWQSSVGVKSLRHGDHAPTEAIRAGSLEIKRPASDYDGLFDGHGDCGTECRAVLGLGRVQWVRVVVPERITKDKRQPSTFHTLSTAPDCLTAPPGPARADCVTIADDPGAPADVVITFDQPPMAAPGPTDLIKWRTPRRVVAHLATDGKRREIFRQTAISVDVPSVPAILGIEIHGMSSSGIAFARTTKTINPITLRSTLTALGLLSANDPLPATKSGKPRTWTDGIDAAMTRQVIAVLDLKHPEPFNAETARVISDWIMAARQTKAWSPDLIAVLRRIVRDRRIQSPTSFDQIFERQPVVSAALMPDVLDLLETHGVSGTHTPERQAAYTFQRLETARLAPFADRILALMGKNKDLRNLLLPAVGRLGVDPSPHLIPFAADLDQTQRTSFAQHYPRVRAACSADGQWATRLVPALKEALTAQSSLPNPDTRFDLEVLKALAQLGEIDFVQSALAGRDDRQSARIAERLRKRPTDTRRRDNLCNAW